MTKEERIKELHRVAQLFKETAEKCGFDRIAVLWGVILEDGKVASGVTLTEMEGVELADICFRVMGTAYNLTDFDS